MLVQVRRFLELIRFSHTLFALPFALLSAVLAWQYKGRMQFLELLGILLCMVCARSTAMAFNRLADRHYDAANPRTANRHLPRGLLSVRAVMGFTIACALGFMISTALFLAAEPPNPWPVYLALPVLLFICLYSYAKRFTMLAHFWLGASLMLAPLAAWIAINGLQALATPLVLGLAVLFWVAGFDLLYACQDADFDRQAGLASIPARLGIAAALRIALGCHVLTLGLLLALYWAATPLLGGVYLAGLAGIAFLLFYEHWLVRPDDLTRVNQAFFQVNAIISVGLFILVVLEWLVRS